jgi:hypothetical protein
MHRCASRTAGSQQRADAALAAARAMGESNARSGAPSGERGASVATAAEAAAPAAKAAKSKVKAASSAKGSGGDVTLSRCARSAARGAARKQASRVPLAGSVPAPATLALYALAAVQPTQLRLQRAVTPQ